MSGVEISLTLLYFNVCDEQGDGNTLQLVDDQDNWKHVMHSLDVLDFSQTEQKVRYMYNNEITHLE